MVVMRRSFDSSLAVVSCLTVADLLLWRFEWQHWGAKEWLLLLALVAWLVLLTTAATLVGAALGRLRVAGTVESLSALLALGGLAAFHPREGSLDPCILLTWQGAALGLAALAVASAIAWTVRRVETRVTPGWALLGPIAASFALVALALMLEPEPLRATSARRVVAALLLALVFLLGMRRWTDRARMAVRVSVVVVLALLGPSWLATRAAPVEALAWSEPEPTPTSAPSPDIVLVVADSLRRDRMAVGLPFLAGLARSPTCVSIDGIESPSNWTLPSVGSMFTGRTPFELGVVEAGRLDTAHRTLAAALSRSGYATLAVTANAWITAETGLGRGFHEGRLVQYRYWKVHRRTPARLLSRLFGSTLVPGFTGPNVRGAFVTQEALGLASRVSPARPMFLYLHFMDAHHPYRAPRDEGAGLWRAPPADPARYLIEVPWAGTFNAGVGAETRERLRRAYDASLADLDEAIRQLVEGLGRQRPNRPRVLVVTADHGEMLGEHDAWGHGASLFREELDVPFVACGVEPSWLPQQGPSSTTRALAFLWGLGGVDPPTAGPAGELTVVEAGFSRRYARDAVAVRSGAYKYVTWRSGGKRVERMIDLAADANEASDSAARHPQLYQRLREVAAARLALPVAEGPGYEAEGERLRQLRALGYLR
ncbi:MAG TPA: sulfatase-like hydrolase/transferase [Vicinamibacteria bacterium]|nr:sulfatase-like hydrolase/transferase [Vicinamibacteria bacterium]